MGIKRLIAVMMVLVSVTGYSENSPEPLSHYNLKCYGVGQGLPQNSVTDIAINSDGQLLVATYSGVVVFDGNRFSNLVPATIEAFPAVEAFTLAVGNDGAIWVGTTSSGLYRVVGSAIEHWDVDNGLKSHIIRKIRPSQEGVFINNDERILFFKYAQEQKLEQVNDVSSLFLSIFKNINKHIISTSYSNKSDVNKSVYLAENGQVFKIENDQRKLLISEFIKNTHVSITKLMLDRKNRLWIATATNGLFRYTNKGLESYNLLPNNRLSSIVEDEDGAIWIGTSGGLCMLKNGAIRNLGLQQGLLNENIHSVGVDFDDNVYAIPYGKISHVTSIGKSQTHNEKIELTNEDEGYVVVGISQDENGNLWIATESMIGQLLREEGKLSIDAVIQLDAKIRSFLIKDNSVLYHHGTDLIKYENNNTSAIPFPIPDNGVVDIRSMSLAYNGDVLVAEKNNVYRLDEDKLNLIDIQTGIISCAHEFTKDELWVCSDGLWLRTHGRNHYFDNNNGLTNVFNGHIHDVIDDKYGNIWVMSNSGLFRILRQELDDYLSGKNNQPQFVKFSEKDGMKSSEFNGSSLGVVKTNDGRLWFASQGGVVEVDPELALFNSKKQLKPFVEHLFISNESIANDQWNNIAPNPKTVHMHFGAVFLSESKNISFRYKLLPYHNNWQFGDAIDLPNLNPGKYQLSVEARFYQNDWSNPFVKHLIVLPAWYQTWWFRIIASISVLLILIGLPYWRIQRLKQHRKDLKLQVESQTKSLLAANERLDKLSRLDELTDIANRREFINKIEKLCNNAMRTPCLALIDIDNFKSYNDYYGHLTGDDCLVRVAETLNEFSSENCLVARFGGEEFVILFDSIDIGKAGDIIENIHKAIEKNQIPHEKSLVKTIVSISSGLVERQIGESVESVIDRADVAMYKAKAEGKDRIVVG